jgi:glucose-1-phosphate adenylyltransferase
VEVVQTAPGGHRIEAFWEKPAHLPGRHLEQVLASMGIYVFGRDVLVEALSKDASPAPAFNLYNDRWPILTHMPARPAKFVHDHGDRVGRAVNSMVSNGVIVSGGMISDSVLSPGVRVDSWTRVDQAVILHNSRVHRSAVVQNAILDKNVVVLEGAAVGVDKDRDRARGLVVSPGGVTVVAKCQVVAP